MFKNKKLENIDENVWDIRSRVAQIEASLVYIMGGMEEVCGKRLDEIVGVDTFNEKQIEYGLSDKPSHKILEDAPKDELYKAYVSMGKYNMQAVYFSKKRIDELWKEYGAIMPDVLVKSHPPVARDVGFFYRIWSLLFYPLAPVKEPLFTDSDFPSLAWSRDVLELVQNEDDQSRDTDKAE